MPKKPSKVGQGELFLSPTTGH